jgi:predicted permease
MRKLRALFLRLMNALRARRAEDDFNAELESHIAMDTEDGIRAGLSPEEAHRQALLRIGGAEQARQLHREQRTLPRLEMLVRDIVYSIRTLTRHRSVTAIAMLSIAMGIGANATIFSIINRFALRPPPMGDPANLLALHIGYDNGRCCNSFPFPVYSDLRDQAKSFSGISAYAELVPASIAGGGEPERVFGQAVTSNFFDVSELPMIMGRGFLQDQESAQEVVLGTALWRRQFSADKEILGKTIKISGRTFTVVGVVTPAFHSIDQILNTEFWVPLGNLHQLSSGFPPPSSRDAHWLGVIARLKPGVTQAQATAELQTLANRFALNNPKTDKGNSFLFEQAGSVQQGKNRRMLTLFLTALLVVVLLVLAIACANVSNLLYAQAAGRQRDMAVRLALGATRARLRGQMLIESVFIGIGGGLLGTVLSLWSTTMLSALRLPAPVPIDLSVHADWRVLVFAFGLSVVSGLLLGLAPAWTASRPSLGSALKGQDTLARPGRRITLRNLLVVAQIAMSVVLLCITGLFLRSLESAASIDIGFRSKNLLLMSVDPNVHGYSAERTVNFLSLLQQRVAALPGVSSAIVTDVAPLTGGNRSDGFSEDGRPTVDQSTISSELTMVMPGYFDTLGIPLVSGRDFGSETATGPKLAIVNRTFVNTILRGENPIGKHVNGAGVHYEIIGVAGNTKSRTLGEEQRPVLYRSLRQSVAKDPSFLGYTLVVRTEGQPGGFAQAVRNEIHTLDPAMAIFNDETMEEHVRTAYFLPRLAATLFGTFGCIGLVLASVGLYGVMSYSVSSRRREIGIRMAMGARPGTVERLVLRQGALLTLIAMMLGWPAAWMLSKLAASFLYGIQPHDVFTFAAVPPVLFLIALAACWIPARRAASVDPMQALRTE